MATNIKKIRIIRKRNRPNNKIWYFNHIIVNELQVWSNDGTDVTNVALKGKASYSIKYKDIFPASNLNNAELSDYYQRTIAGTEPYVIQNLVGEYIQLELDRGYSINEIQSIVLFNHQKDKRMDGLSIQLLNNNNRVLAETPIINKDQNTQYYRFDGIGMLNSLTYFYSNSSNNGIISTSDDNLTKWNIINHAVQTVLGTAFKNTAKIPVSTKETNPPTMNLIGNENIAIKKGIDYVDSGVVAYDDSYGPVEINIKKNINTNKVGKQQFIWEAIDKFGNKNTIIRNVIIDSAIPVITLIGDKTVNILKNQVYNDRGVKVRDPSGIVPRKDIKLTIRYKRNGVFVNKLDTSIIGNYEIIYSAVDIYGNKAIDVNRFVIVKNPPRPISSFRINNFDITESKLTDTSFIRRLVGNSEPTVNNLRKIGYNTNSEGEIEDFNGSVLSKNTRNLLNRGVKGGRQPLAMIRTEFLSASSDPTKINITETASQYSRTATSISNGLRNLYTKSEKVVNLITDAVEESKKPDKEVILKYFNNNIVDKVIKPLNDLRKDLSFTRRELNSIRPLERSQRNPVGSFSNMQSIINNSSKGIGFSEVFNDVLPYALKKFTQGDFKGRFVYLTALDAIENIRTDDDERFDDPMINTNDAINDFNNVRALLVLLGEELGTQTIENILDIISDQNLLADDLTTLEKLTEESDPNGIIMSGDLITDENGNVTQVGVIGIKTINADGSSGGTKFFRIVPGDSDESETHTSSAAFNDTKDPTIALIGNKDVYIHNNPYEDLGSLATDNSNRLTLNTYLSSDDIDANPITFNLNNNKIIKFPDSTNLENYLVKYEGTDPSGNMTSKTRVVNVSNTTSNLNLGSNSMASGIYFNNDTQLNNFVKNIAIGYNALRNSFKSKNVIAIGSNSLLKNNDGLNTIAVGTNSLINFKGQTNIAIGTNTGSTLVNGKNNILIGRRADVSNDNSSNQIVIGSGAIGYLNNTCVMGNDDIISFEGKDASNILTYNNSSLWAQSISNGTVELNLDNIVLPTGSSKKVLVCEGSKLTFENYGSLNLTLTQTDSFQIGTNTYTGAFEPNSNPNFNLNFSLTYTDNNGNTVTPGFILKNSNITFLNKKEITYVWTQKAVDYNNDVIESIDVDTYLTNGQLNNVRSDWNLRNNNGQLLFDNNSNLIFIREYLINQGYLHVLESLDNIKTKDNTKDKDITINTNSISIKLKNDEKVEHTIQYVKIQITNDQIINSGITGSGKIYDFTDQYALTVSSKKDKNIQIFTLKLNQKAHSYVYVDIETTEVDTFGNKIHDQKFATFNPGTDTTTVRYNIKSDDTFKFINESLLFKPESDSDPEIIKTVNVTFQDVYELTEVKLNNNSFFMGEDVEFTLTLNKAVQKITNISVKGIPDDTFTSDPVFTFNKDQRVKKFSYTIAYDVKNFTDSTLNMKFDKNGSDTDFIEKEITIKKSKIEFDILPVTNENKLTLNENKKSTFTIRTKDGYPIPLYTNVDVFDSRKPLKIGTVTFLKGDTEKTYNYTAPNIPDTSGDNINYDLSFKLRVSNLAWVNYLNITNKLLKKYEIKVLNTSKSNKYSINDLVYDKNVIQGYNIGFTLTLNKVNKESGPIRFKYDTNSTVTIPSGSKVSTPGTINIPQSTDYKDKKIKGKFELQNYRNKFTGDKSINFEVNSISRSKLVITNTNAERIVNEGENITYSLGLQKTNIKGKIIDSKIPNGTKIKYTLSGNASVSSDYEIVGIQQSVQNSKTGSFTIKNNSNNFVVKTIEDNEVENNEIVRVQFQSNQKYDYLDNNIKAAVQADGVIKSINKYKLKITDNGPVNEGDKINFDIKLGGTVDNKEKVIVKCETIDNPKGNKKWAKKGIDYEAFTKTKSIDVKNDPIIMFNDIQTKDTPYTDGKSKYVRVKFSADNLVKNYFRDIEIKENDKQHFWFPSNNGKTNLGTSGKQFKNLFITGGIKIKNQITGGIKIKNQNVIEYPFVNRDDKYGGVVLNGLVIQSHSNKSTLSSFTNKSNFFFVNITANDIIKSGGRLSIPNKNNGTVINKPIRVRFTSSGSDFINALKLNHDYDYVENIRIKSVREILYNINGKELNTQNFSATKSTVKLVSDSKNDGVNNKVTNEYNVGLRIRRLSRNNVEIKIFNDNEKVKVDSSGPTPPPATTPTPTITPAPAPEATIPPGYSNANHDYLVRKINHYEEAGDNKKIIFTIGSTYIPAFNNNASVQKVSSDSNIESLVINILEIAPSQEGKSGLYYRTPLKYSTKQKGSKTWYATQNDVNLTQVGVIKVRRVETSANGTTNTTDLTSNPYSVSVLNTDFKSFLYIKPPLQRNHEIVLTITGAFKSGKNGGRYAIYVNNLGDPRIKERSYDNNYSGVIALGDTVPIGKPSPTIPAPQNVPAPQYYGGGGYYGQQRTKILSDNYYEVPISSKITGKTSNYQLSNQIINEIKNMSPDEKRMYLDYWLRSAQAEYVSVGGFSALILELLTLGVPDKFLTLANSAMTDEIRHSQIFISLANSVSNKKYEIDKINMVEDNDKNNIYVKKMIKFSKNNDLNKDSLLFLSETQSINGLLNRADIHKEQENRPGLSNLLKEIASDEMRHSELGKKLDAWFKSQK